MSLARGNSKRVLAHGEAAILFAVGPQVFAIPAAAVDRICEMDGLEALAPVGHPRLAKVRHTFDREDRRYYVVDANLLFNMLPSRHQRILLLHPTGKGSAAALAVDSIDRMLILPRVQALPKAFQGDERSWYRGLTIVDDRVIPVVNPATILNSAEQMVLELAVSSRMLAAGARV